MNWKGKKTAVIVLNDGTEAKARSFADTMAWDVIRPPLGELKELCVRLFSEYEGLVFIMASGIVVRMIAPLLKDKYTDPAIVTVDDAFRFAVSTLSGHEGGANDLCWKVASLTGAQAVISTASDTRKDLILGVGCRKGIACETVVQFVTETLEQENIKAEDIRCAASVEIKRNEEGLIDAFDQMGIPLIFIPVKELRESNLEEASVSDAALKHFGIPGVSEHCALLAGKNSRLILKKRKSRGVTLAIAKEDLS